MPGNERIDHAAEAARVLRDVSADSNGTYADYLAVRDAAVPEVDGERFDIVHDIDHGSRGHFRLNASDVRRLTAALEAAYSQKGGGVPTEATISDTIAHAWNIARRQTREDGKERSVIGVAAKAVHDLLTKGAVDEPR